MGGPQDEEEGKECRDDDAHDGLAEGERARFGLGDVFAEISYGRKHAYSHDAHKYQGPGVIDMMAGNNTHNYAVNDIQHAGTNQPRPHAELEKAALVGGVWAKATFEQFW